MKKVIYNTYIDKVMDELKVPQRKTNGRDKSKSYHKITISVNEQERWDIQNFAKKEGKSVSAVIKNMLREEGITS